MLQVNFDKNLGSKDGGLEDKSSQTWDAKIISMGAAEEVSSIPATGHQFLQDDTSVVSGLLASNTADGQAALDSTAVDSAAIPNHFGLLEHSAAYEQSSKLGTEKTHVSASLQPDGTLNKATSKSKPHPSVAPQPVAIPQADRDDLLIVMPSSIDRMPIVTASRGWRQGVRTYIAFEEEIDLQDASSIFKVRTNACQTPS